MKHVYLFSTLVLSSFFISCQAQEEPWVNLFDGKTLDGWEQIGGVAEYSVADGAVFGTTVANTPNSFLRTSDTYSDFILEYEVLLSAETNSGVQIRSNSIPEFENGRTHGYQIEIDPSDRAWTGGIYDEARRGWLYPLRDMPEANAAYKHLEWNKFRVEAIGNTFKTWVNGVPVAHLVDDRTAEGFIGLQVHSIGNPDDAGITIKWRNIRIITENPEEYSMETPISAKDNYNVLTFSQEDWGWELLYDGETMDKWRSARSDDFPYSDGGTGWDVENGILKINESGGAESADAGDIVTRELFSNFELWVDFKVTPGANSGIKYFVDANLNKGTGSSIGLEYQILDDDLHPDAKLGAQPGSRTVASLYDLIKAENKPIHPVGEWNHARVISKGDHVEHWLNGRLVLEYNRNTPEFQQLVDESKYAKWPGFGTWTDGNILLQDHGNEVHFRNIFIKKLN
tara:strand:+ start:59616 stop:60983 length:1368 start_codon:yes stop_codon:yes gene_type:complete